METEYKADDASKLSSLSKENQAAIKRLMEYGQSMTSQSLADLGKHYPRSKLAAVLVLLFEKDGLIRVLLTTRAKTLRSHPGQTALPGGKCDPDDSAFLATALREAYEECALSPKDPSLQYIGQLPPFLSQWKLIVTPIVMLCTDPERVIPSLKPQAAEVDAIFSHPLEAVLDPSMSLSLSLPLSEKGSENWPYEDDVYNTSDSTWTQIRGSIYRMHRFRTSGSPIKGLTADVLIMAAEIAFEKLACYDRYAYNQPTSLQMTRWAVEDYAENGEIPPATPTGYGTPLPQSRDQEAAR